MAVEEIARLRTIAIVGQGGTGKTQLAEAMLFTAGAVGRLGRPDDGTASTDFEPEELVRHVSISTGFHHLNWKKTEVIICDTPGYSAFLPDSINTLHAVDGVVFVVSPGGDLKVEAEKLWEAASELGLPRIAFVSRLDRERASFSSAVDDLEKSLGAKLAPLTIPIGAELAFKGVVDLLSMKALLYPDANGKPREEDLNGELTSEAQRARTALCEVVAETDDALLEKYLESGTLEAGEVRTALRAAVCAGKITPLLCGSGAKNIGEGPLLDAIVSLLPSPAERPPIGATDGVKGQALELEPNPKAPFSAFVFKTVNDPFAGKLSIFRVVSGQALSDSSVLNVTHQVKERFGQLLRLEGKKQSPIASALPGEIVAVAKLKEAFTNDSLADEKTPVLFNPPPKPQPLISFAIRPKTKGDEEKASLALHKMVEEDPALEMHRDAQTHDIILSGTGQLHIEVTVERLRR
ncbi:MAG TPA: GTP-binding protein, partial [Candidatus Binataceae bacterium]